MLVFPPKQEIEERQEEQAKDPNAGQEEADDAGQKNFVGAL